jgi:hypothetical protein
MREKLGRKLRYGEPTQAIRVPVSMIPLVEEMLKNREVLEMQWHEKLIGPDAQKLVDLITELMITPQMGLIQALKDSGLPGFHDEIERLNTDLEETRKLYRGTTTNALLEVLQASS